MKRLANNLEDIVWDIYESFAKSHYIEDFIDGNIYKTPYVQAVYNPPEPDVNYHGGYDLNECSSFEDICGTEEVDYIIKNSDVDISNYNYNDVFKTFMNEVYPEMKNDYERFIEFNFVDYITDLIDLSKPIYKKGCKQKRLIAEVLVNPSKNEVEDHFYFSVDRENVSVSNNVNDLSGMIMEFNNFINVINENDAVEVAENLYKAKNNLLKLLGNYNYDIKVNNEIIETRLLDILQDFNSAKTSLNQISRIHTNTKFEPNTVVLDYGGGKFDKAVEFMKSQNVLNLVYDPYNRSNEHNREVLDYIKENNGADYVVCANVLNVIKEESIIRNVLEDLDKYCKNGGIIRICVYEGNKQNDGKGNDSKNTYQRNSKTKDYEQIIRDVYENKGYNVDLKNNIYEIKKR